MCLRLSPLLFIAALSMTPLVPQLARAAPIDLGDDESEEVEDDPFFDGEELIRGGTTLAGDRESRGELIIEEGDFDEPVELFFDGLPEDEDLPDEVDRLLQQLRSNR